MPIVSSPYRSPRWLLSKHLESVLPVCLRKLQEINYKRERFFTEDDDFIDLDWSISGHNNLSFGLIHQKIQGNSESFFDFGAKGNIGTSNLPRRKVKKTPEEEYQANKHKTQVKKLAILTYGAIASPQSSYILGMAKKLSLAGYDSVVWNFRGAQEPNRLRRFYHAGNSDDLHHVVQYISQTKSYQELVLVGFSYGGNIVLKYLGEMGQALNKSITRAVTISVPCELGSCTKELTKLENFFYARDFIKKVKGRLQSKKRAFPEKFHDFNFNKIRSIIELDTKIATQLNDFTNLDHYYRVCSSKQYIPNIAIPTLILNAQNDPLLSEDNFPIRECENHPWVTLEMPQDGGHIGFMMSSINGPYYSEERTLDFILNK